MAYEDITAEGLLSKLERAGRYPQPELIDAIWERREETEPLLLAMFRESLEDEWADDDDPRWYRLVHAGKFMLSWQNLDALPIFSRFYATDDKGLQDMLEWFEEDLYYYGPAAIPYLKEIASKDTGGEWAYGPGLSGSILTRIATYYPETRNDIAAFFRSLLPTMEEIPSLKGHNDMWENVAGELGLLADEESRELVLSLFEAGLFREKFIDRNGYLRYMNKGFKPEQPPDPYDIRDDYRRTYEWHQENLRQEARSKREEREKRVRQAASRTGPKIGRNDPCPCGSGKKYKHCHGRPGA